MKRLLAGLLVALAACGGGDDAAPWRPVGSGAGSGSGSAHRVGIGPAAGGGFVPGTGASSAALAGTGLEASGVQLSIDPTYTQRRVSGTCSSGNAIQTVNQDGTVTCQSAGGVSGGTTGDLTAWISSTAVGNYAGSTPAACSAGQAVTQPALSAAGVLTDTCSSFVTSSALTNTDLVAATGAGAIANYAGSTPSACTSGQAVTQPALSAAGALTTTCGTFFNTAGTGLSNSTNTVSLNTGAITVTDAGTQDNYNPSGLSTALMVRANNSSTLTIDGLAARQDGAPLFICAVNTANVILAAEAAGSTAANRIWPITATGAPTSITLTGGTNGNSCAELLYDTTSSRFRVVAVNYENIAAPFQTSGAFTAAGGATISSSTFVISSATSPIDVHSQSAVTLSGCGSSPTIHGTEIAGRITTGTSSGTCVITFPSAYSSPPSCSVDLEGSTSTPNFAVAAASITITSSASSANYDYQCFRVQ